MKVLYWIQRSPGYQCSRKLLTKQKLKGRLYNILSSSSSPPSGSDLTPKNLADPTNAFHPLYQNNMTVLSDSSPTSISISETSTAEVSFNNSLFHLKLKI